MEAVHSLLSLHAVSKPLSITLTNTNAYKQSVVLSSIIGPHQSWETAATFLEKGIRMHAVVTDNTCYLIQPCMLETIISFCLSLCLKAVHDTCNCSDLLLVITEVTVE